MRRSFEINKKRRGEEENGGDGRRVKLKLDEILRVAIIVVVFICTCIFVEHTTESIMG